MGDRLKRVCFAGNARLLLQKLNVSTVCTTLHFCAHDDCTQHMRKTRHHVSRLVEHVPCKGNPGRAGLDSNHLVSPRASERLELSSAGVNSLARVVARLGAT